MKKQTSTYPLRLPASLKSAIAEISKEEGTSINQFVAMAVAGSKAKPETGPSMPGKRPFESALVRAL